MDWLKKNIVSDYLRPPITIPVDDDDDELLLLDQKNKDHVDWLELPEDVLYQIALKFYDAKVYIRFGAVCQLWRSFYIHNQHFLSRKPPLLLLATHLNSDDQTRSFYSLLDKKIVNSQVHVPHNLFIPGSSYGWLVTVSETHQISLFNPFLLANNEIELPPLTTFQVEFGCIGFATGYRGFLKRVVLSANPTSNPNYVALAIFGAFSSLAYYKTGDKGWTTLPSNFGADDIIYYQDQFYIMCSIGALYTWDPNNPQSPFSLVASRYCFAPNKRYLVESSGELLQILRHIDWDDNYEHSCYFNAGFDVVKLNLVKLQWIKINNLQGCVLFLGNNDSFSISAYDFPGCKPNTIYFTDDYYEGYFNEEDHFGAHDIGVFNIEDRTLEQHYPITSNKFFPAPIWVEFVQF